MTLSAAIPSLLVRISLPGILLNRLHRFDGVLQYPCWVSPSSVRILSGNQDLNPAVLFPITPV